MKSGYFSSLLNTASFFSINSTKNYLLQNSKPIRIIQCRVRNVYSLVRVFIMLDEGNKGIFKFYIMINSLLLVYAQF
jgi:hypothetical protein